MKRYNMSLKAKAEKRKIIKNKKKLRLIKNY